MQRILTLSSLCFVHAVAVTDPCLDGNHKQLSNLGARNEHCIAANIPTYDRLCDNYLSTQWYLTKDAVMLNNPPKTGSCGVNMPVWLIDRLPIVADGISDRDVCVKVGNEACHEIITIQIKNCSTFYVYKLQQLPDHIGCPAAYCFVSVFPCSPTPQPTSSRLPNFSTKGVTIAPGPSTNSNHDVSGKDNQHTTTLIASLTVSVVVIALMAVIVAVLALKHKKDARVSQVEQQYNTIQDGISPPMYESLDLTKY